MKKMHFLPVIAAAVLLAFSSCKKDHPGRTSNSSSSTSSTINLSATVKAGDTYRLNLSSYGNGTATIIKQAASFNVSQISTDATGSKTYQYTSSLNPKNGANTDEVTLKISSASQSSGGCDHHNDDDNYSSNARSEKIINIKFTIN